MQLWITILVPKKDPDTPNASLRADALIKVQNRVKKLPIDVRRITRINIINTFTINGNDFKAEELHPGLIVSSDQGTLLTQTHEVLKSLGYAIIYNEVGAKDIWSDDFNSFI